MFDRNFWIGSIAVSAIFYYYYRTSAYPTHVLVIWLLVIVVMGLVNWSEK